VAMKTLGNLIVRLAASPFTILGGLVNASPDDLSSASFAVGTARITEASRKSLGALARAMQERPGINVEVNVVSIDPLLEISGTRQAMLRQSLEKASILELPEGTSPEERYAAMIEEAYQRQLDPDNPPPELPGVVEMERLLLSRIEVTGEDLEGLAMARKEAVRDYLVEEEGIDPGRILLGPEEELQLVESGLSQARLSIR